MRLISPGQQAWVSPSSSGMRIIHHSVPRASTGGYEMELTRRLHSGCGRRPTAHPNRMAWNDDRLSSESSPATAENAMTTASLADRVVIVTGGGRGLGRVVAKALYVVGANVVVCGRDVDVLKKAAQSIDPVGKSVLPVVCDITDEQAVSQLVFMAHQRFGRIDALVNNAGIAGPTSRLWESSPRDWRETLDTNVTGAY
jgi:hypothetical protein